MRGALLVALVLVAGLSAQAPPDPAASSPLAACDRLKADNLKLRAQVLELQRALAQTQLERESERLQADRQALEQAFRAALKPAAGEVFDWQTLTFGPPPATPPSPQP